MRLEIFRNCKESELRHYLLKINVDNNKIPLELISDKELFKIGISHSSDNSYITYLREKGILIKFLNDDMFLSLFNSNHYYALPPQRGITCKAGETKIELKSHSKFRLMYYDSMVLSGKLGSCAGKSSDNPLIEAIWKDIKHEWLLDYSGLTEFYGYMNEVNS